MKKSFLISLLLTLAFASVTHAYSDVHNATDYSEAIASITEDGIVEGYDDNTFRPKDSINRAEFTKILVESKLGEKPEEYADKCFPDMNASAWYAPYICYAKEHEILDGYPDGTFKASNRVNLAEASKIIVNLFEIETEEAEGDNWYSEYIEALDRSSFIPPSFGYFSEDVNRGEMAEMIWRIREDKHDEDTTKLPDLQEVPCQSSGEDLQSNIDMDEVRATWLGWYNDARAAEGLHAYTLNEQLERSAIAWSEISEDRGYMDHRRQEGAEYYDYWMIADWFEDQGLTFENRYRVTFTENIGWGPFRCSSSKSDCTDEMIDTIRGSFDFYMDEKYDDYKPHYNSLMNEYFDEIGLGIAVDEGAGQYYLSVHYGTKITSDPLPICEA
jgi:hypothetical protein